MQRYVASCGSRQNFPGVGQARPRPIREECRNFQSYETPAAFVIIDVGNIWKSLSFINGQDRVSD